MSKRTASDILWYIPNKIGYIRVLTMIISCLLMKEHPMYTTVVYGISCLLDALDGTMARKYNQTSTLGAVLDMVTDRSTTCALICFLCTLYPRWLPVFQILIALDLSSHYMHMYATLTSGGNSHKMIEKDQWLLHMYYSRREVLFAICAFNEVFYMALYLNSFPHLYNVNLPVLGDMHIGMLLSIICAPGYIFKQIANIIQLNRAIIVLANYDANEANKGSKKI